MGHGPRCRHGKQTRAKRLALQLRKVIDVIIKHGVRDHRGYFITTFSVIFDKTDKLLEVCPVMSPVQTEMALFLDICRSTHTLTDCVHPLAGL